MPSASVSARRLDPAAHLGQRNRRAALAGRARAAEDDLVAVLEEGALGAVGETKRLLAGAGRLQQAAVGSRLETGDRAGGVEVAGADGGAVDGGVGELLGAAPVEAARVGSGDHVLLARAGRDQGGLQLQIEGPGLVRSQVLVRWRVLLGPRYAEGLERRQRRDPRPDRGGEGLAEEGA